MKDFFQFKVYMSVNKQIFNEFEMSFYTKQIQNRVNLQFPPVCHIRSTCCFWRHWIPLSKTSILTWYIPMHKVTNLRHRPFFYTKMNDKSHCYANLLAFRCKIKGFRSNFCYYFLKKKYVTSDGAVSHHVLYYQQLSVALNQVRFYASNYFE